ncbi:MAG: DUF2062 domain-containing protein [Bacteroidota bacterium]
MSPIKEKTVKWLTILKEKLVQIKSDPKKICLGYAFGVFLATTPFVGIKVFIALLFTKVFKWSKVAAVIGVYHINILTAPLFYGFSFLVGKQVLGAQIDFSYPEKVSVKALLDIFCGNISIFYSLLLGGLILGIPLTIGAYYLSMYLMHNAKRNSDEKDIILSVH